MGLPTSKVFIPGFRLIADDAGSYIDDVANIRLGPEFALTRNTADPSAVISVSAYIAATVNTAVAAALSANDIPQKIDSQSLSAAASYVSPAWAAGLYKEIIVKFDGAFSAFAYLGFRANVDSGNNYVDIGTNNNTSVSSDSSANGTLGFARCGVSVTASIKVVNEIHFFPLTDTRERGGWAVSGAVGPGALSTTFQRLNSFGWTDKSTDVTKISLLPSTAATMSGKVTVLGVKA